MMVSFIKKRCNKNIFLKPNTSETNKKYNDWYSVSDSIYSKFTEFRIEK